MSPDEVLQPLRYTVPSYTRYMRASSTLYFSAGMNFSGTHLASMLITVCVHSLQQRVQQLSSRTYVMSTSNDNSSLPANLTLSTRDAVGTCKDS